jgi:hypothetical protein
LPQVFPEALSRRQSSDTAWSSAHDLEELALTFAKRGSLVLDDALQATVAQAVTRSIDQAGPAFRLVARNGVHPRMMVFDKPLSPAKEAVLRQQLAVAREGGLFTCIFRLWEIPEPETQDAAWELKRFLMSEECWTWIERISAIRPMACQVAGVDEYRAGDYLGAHSDRLVKFGRRRKIAFALYFGRNWEPGMGGELVLVRGDGEKERVAPLWNRLVLFDVDRVDKHYSATVMEDGFKKISLPGFFCV